MGIPIGIALRHQARSAASTARSMGVALVFVSMPTFWLGLIVLFLFANDIGQFHIFPGRQLLRGADRQTRSSGSPR